MSRCREIPKNAIIYRHEKSVRKSAFLQERGRGQVRVLQVLQNEDQRVARNRPLHRTRSFRVQVRPQLQAARKYRKNPCSGHILRTASQIRLWTYAPRYRRISALWIGMRHSLPKQRSSPGSTRRRRIVTTGIVRLRRHVQILLRTS